MCVILEYEMLSANHWRLCVCVKIKIWETSSLAHATVKNQAETANGIRIAK